METQPTTPPQAPDMSGASKPWPKRHPILTGIGGLVVLSAVFSAFVGGGGDAEAVAEPAAAETVTVTATATETETADPEPAETVTVTAEPEPAETVTVEAEPQPAETVTETVTVEPAEGPEPEPAAPAVADGATLARQNALEEAQQYLDYSGFSWQGLIDQLSSQYGGQYDLADAEWAVDHLDVDWKEQAVREAEAYLDYSSFSRQGLIDQLSSEYGGQFTVDQATYAADQVGL